MSNSGMILLLVACLFARTIAIIQYPNLNETTNCPLDVKHECTLACAEDQNRYGCVCELDGGDVIVTASIFTPCPVDPTDPCKNHMCQNGATCIQEGLASYKCTCASGFGGNMCETTLPKCSDAGISCPNAECVETNNPVVPVFCQCYDGTQRDPQKNQTCPLSPCYEPGTENSVCQNGGICRIINSAYICECKGGFAGKDCTQPLKTPLCEDQPGVCGVGRCQQSLAPPYYSCNCGSFPSTFGKVITELIKCEASGCYSSNPCLNGGTCSNKINGAFRCQCPSQYTGAKCEKKSACFSNPCVNQGTCEAFNETTFFCNCPPYYSGQRCETKLPNPCLTKSCGPYGQCIDNQGTAICRCSDGDHLDGSPCTSPCINKNCGIGACTTKPNASYEAVCSCPINRQGDSCELPRDPCREAPRCGGGYCKPNYAATRGYSCICEGGIIKPDPCPFSKTCPIKDCGTQGICVETDGLVPTVGSRPIYYVCLCQQGYISAGSCDDLINTQIPAVSNRCAPNGKVYPSRNPNNPVGCWCNNGTHIEEIDVNGPSTYCP